METRNTTPWRWRASPWTKPLEAAWPCWLVKWAAGESRHYISCCFFLWDRNFRRRQPFHRVSSRFPAHRPATPPRPAVSAFQPGGYWRWSWRGRPYYNLPSGPWGNRPATRPFSPGLRSRNLTPPNGPWERSAYPASGSSPARALGPGQVVAAGHPASTAQSSPVVRRRPGPGPTPPATGKAPGNTLAGPDGPSPAAWNRAARVLSAGDSRLLGRGGPLTPPAEGLYDFRQSA